jgi:hypothetical protein
MKDAALKVTHSAITQRSPENEGLPQSGVTRGRTNETMAASELRPIARHPRPTVAIPIASLRVPAVLTTVCVVETQHPSRRAAERFAIGFPGAIARPTEGSVQFTQQDGGKYAVRFNMSTSEGGDMQTLASCAMAVLKVAAETGAEAISIKVGPA